MLKELDFKIDFKSYIDYMDKSKPKKTKFVVKPKKKMKFTVKPVKEQAKQTEPKKKMKFTVKPKKEFKPSLKHTRKSFGGPQTGRKSFVHYDKEKGKETTYYENKNGYFYDKPVGGRFVGKNHVFDSKSFKKDGLIIFPLRKGDKSYYVDGSYYE